jgi:hypothetical protein
MKLFCAARHLLLWAVVLLCSQVVSANDTLPAPKPPYVASIGENAQWIVTFTYDNPDASAATDKTRPFVPPGCPVQLKTVKWGTSFQFFVSYADGSSTRYDQMDNYIVVPTVNGLRLSAADPNDLPFANYATDFIFTQWLRDSGASSYQKIEVKNGVRCFYYRDEGKRAAWINIETMAPVVVHDDLITQASFQVLPAPTSPIVFPDAELKMIADQKALVKAFRSLR